MTESLNAVRRFVAGEDEAFTELVHHWELRVYNLAWRFTGSREDAQDVVQDTFLSVYRSIKGLRDPSAFPSWLYKVALNHCRARWRNRTDDLPLEETLAAEGRGGEIGALEPRGNLRDDVETIDLIRKGLMGLSEEHRTAIILKEYLGLNLQEVAEVMNCPLSTAKSRLYHGLRGVQRNLKRLGAVASANGTEKDIRLG